MNKMIIKFFSNLELKNYNILNIFKKNLVEDNFLKYDKIYKFLTKPEYSNFKITDEGELNFKDFNLDKKLFINKNILLFLEKCDNFLINIKNFTGDEIFMVFFNLLKINKIEEIDKDIKVNINKNMMKLINLIRIKKFDLNTELFKINLIEFLSYSELDYLDPNINIIFYNFVNEIKIAKNYDFLIDILNNQLICKNENVLYKKLVFYLYKIIKEDINKINYKLKILILERSSQHKIVSNKYKEYLKKLIEDDLFKEKKLDFNYFNKYINILILTRNISKDLLSKFYKIYLNNLNLNKINDVKCFLVLYHKLLRSLVNIDDDHFIKLLQNLDENSIDNKLYFNYFIPVINYYLLSKIINESKYLIKNKELIFKIINKINTNLNNNLKQNNIIHDIFKNKLINYKKFLDKIKIDKLIKIDYNYESKISNKYNKELFFNHNFTESNPIDVLLYPKIKLLYPNIIKEKKIENFFVDFYEENLNQIIEINGNIHFNRNKEILKINYYNKKLILLLSNYNLIEFNFKDKIHYEELEKIKIEEQIKLSLEENENFKQNIINYLNELNK